jgi:23S rRNA (guanosine2251-2'-O)-methyltransferase
MPDFSYEIRQCLNPGCALRYPVVEISRFAKECPRCGAATRLIMAQKRSDEPVDSTNLSFEPPLEALLDNIRSAWNVGSMFRTADGVSLRHMHLCGITADPQNPKVQKTSLGAEKSVSWSRYNDGLQAAQSLQQRGMRLWALESQPHSISLDDVIDDLPGQPIVIVVGNENTGVDPEILDHCERIIHLPMVGMKRSYNAAVAFGIAVYTLRFNPVSRSTPMDR